MAKQNKRTKPDKYPWDQWFASGTFTARRGTDFKGQPHGFYKSVRGAAKVRGLHVGCRIMGNEVTVTVLGKV